MSITYILTFSDVRCGQLHCRDGDEFRLAVGVGVIVLSRTAFTSEGFVRCR